MQEIEVNYVGLTNYNSVSLSLDVEDKFSIDSDILYIHGIDNSGTREHTVLINPRIISDDPFYNTLTMFIKFDEIIFMRNKPDSREEVMKELI